MNVSTPTPRKDPSKAGRRKPRLLAAFGAVLCFAFWEFMHTALERGDQTQDLRWPLWPFYCIAALECAALSLLAIGEAFGLVRPLNRDSA